MYFWEFKKFQNLQKKRGKIKYLTFLVPKAFSVKKFERSRSDRGAYNFIVPIFPVEPK